MKFVEAHMALTNTKYCDLHPHSTVLESHPLGKERPRSVTIAIAFDIFRNTIEIY